MNYVRHLRIIIKNNILRRIASTRMIQAGQKMKKAGVVDWKKLLIINWSDTEKMIVNNYFNLKTNPTYVNEAHYKAV